MFGFGNGAEFEEEAAWWGKGWEEKQGKDATDRLLVQW